MTPNCKLHPVPATGTCNNCRAFTCGKCAKVGRPCPFCKVSDIVPAGEARKSVNQCVKHPGIRAHAACPDCQRIFCASCLNPFGQCMECGAKHPRQQPTMAPAQPPREGGKRKTRGKKRYFLGVTRTIIGLAILAGVGALLNWQYTALKNAVPRGKAAHGTVAGKVDAYRKAVDAHGKDLGDIMNRIDSGEYSQEDQAAVDDLMAKIESGRDVQRVDPATRERLERARAMLHRDEEPGRADEGSAPGTSRYEGPPIRLRVGQGHPEPARGRRGTQVAYRPRPVRVAITHPGSGARLHGSTTISASLAGDDVQRVEFHVNGQWQGISNRPPFRFDWDTTSVRNGGVTLRVVAFDGAGRQYPSKPIRVTVQN